MPWNIYLLSTRCAFWGNVHQCVMNVGEHIHSLCVCSWALVLAPVSNSLSVIPCMPPRAVVCSSTTINAIKVFIQFEVCAGLDQLLLESAKRQQGNSCSVACALSACCFCVTSVNSGNMLFIMCNINAVTDSFCMFNLSTYSWFPFIFLCCKNLKPDDVICCTDGLIFIGHSEHVCIYALLNCIVLFVVV